jgi:hypothetical protein
MISRYSRNRKYSRIRNFSCNNGTGNRMLRYPTEMPDARMPMSMGMIRKNSTISSRIRKYSQISRHSRIREQSRKRNLA